MHYIFQGLSFLSQTSSILVPSNPVKTQKTAIADSSSNPSSPSKKRLSIFTVVARLNYRELSAIKVAVVGVILNLVLFFGYHVLWPNEFSGHFDGISALIRIAAAVTLFRQQHNVIYVIIACALLSLLGSVFQ